MPNAPETSIGGANERFPETRWSLIRASIQDRPAAPPPELGALIRHYWRPVYGLIRRSFDISIEDAKDLTQDFFAKVIDGPLLAQSDPARGSFRSFVKVSVKNFVNRHLRDAAALKRAGSRTAVPLDEADVEGLIRANAADSPEELFDRAWTRTVLHLAVARVEEEFRAEGKGVMAEAFHDYYLDGKPYREIAARLEIAEYDVANHLHAGRRRFRQAVERILRETVSNGDEMNDEIRRFF